jgi:hypothetical protein
MKWSTAMEMMKPRKMKNNKGSAKGMSWWSLRFIPNIAEKILSIKSNMVFSSIKLLKNRCLAIKNNQRKEFAEL